jgi:hypothetical protein
MEAEEHWRASTCASIEMVRRDTTVEGTYPRTSTTRCRLKKGNGPARMKCKHDKKSLDVKCRAPRAVHPHQQEN